MPQGVLPRPKTGCGAPLRRGLQHVLQGLVAETLSPARLAADGLFNPSAVQKLLDDQCSGRRDASYTIWSLLCISLSWERQQASPV